MSGISRPGKRSFARPPVSYLDNGSGPSQDAKAGQPAIAAMSASTLRNRGVVRSA